MTGELHDLPVHDRHHDALHMLSEPPKRLVPLSFPPPYEIPEPVLTRADLDNLNAAAAKRARKLATKTKTCSPQ